MRALRPDGWRDRIMRALRGSDPGPVCEESTIEEGPPVTAAEVWVSERIEDATQRIKSIRARVVILRQEFGVKGSGDAPTDSQMLAGWPSLLGRAVKRTLTFSDAHPTRMPEAVDILATLLDRIEASDYETRVPILEMFGMLYPRLPSQPRLSLLERTPRGLCGSEFEPHLHRLQMLWVTLFAAHPEQKTESVSILRAALVRVLDPVADTEAHPPQLVSA